MLFIMYYNTISVLFFTLTHRSVVYEVAGFVSPQKKLTSDIYDYYNSYCRTYHKRNFFI